MRNRKTTLQHWYFLCNQMSPFFSQSLWIEPSFFYHSWFNSRTGSSVLPEQQKARSNFPMPCRGRDYHIWNSLFKQRYSVFGFVCGHSATQMWLSLQYVAAIQLRKIKKKNSLRCSGNSYRNCTHPLHGEYVVIPMLAQPSALTLNLNLCHIPSE